MTDYSETDTCWHIMVTTYGGKVSLMQNLDAPTARQAYRHLCPDERPTEYINTPESGGWSIGGGGRTISDSTIKSAVILGPEGAELDPWRGIEPHIIDVGKEIEFRKRSAEFAEQMMSKNSKRRPAQAHTPPASKTSHLGRWLGLD